MKIARKITPRDEWEHKLYKEYPKLFGQKDKPITQTCMCWGISVGIGWFPIIELLCNAIQTIVDTHQLEQIEFTQIKEKYGTLRIYTNYHDERIQKLINTAECLSGYICEDCGSVKGVSQTKGYIITLCKICMEERNKKWSKKPTK